MTDFDHNVELNQIHCEISAIFGFTIIKKEIKDWLKEKEIIYGTLMTYPKGFVIKFSNEMDAVEFKLRWI